MQYLRFMATFGLFLIFGSRVSAQKSYSKQIDFNDYFLCSCIFHGFPEIEDRDNTRGYYAEVLLGNKKDVLRFSKIDSAAKSIVDKIEASPFHDNKGDKAILGTCIKYYKERIADKIH
jgi:hypothetical protein